MATATTQRLRVATKLAEIPDHQLACRAGRHDWPSDKLQAGKPLPRGLTAVPHAEVRGVFQLRDVCQRCNKIRVLDTLPNGVYDVNAQYSYRDPKDWVKLSQDLDVYKRDLRAENFARAGQELFR